MVSVLFSKLNHITIRQLLNHSRELLPVWVAFTGIFSRWAQDPLLRLIHFVSETSKRIKHSIYYPVSYTASDIMEIVLVCQLSEVRFILMHAIIPTRLSMP